LLQTVFNNQQPKRVDGQPLSAPSGSLKSVTRKGRHYCESPVDGYVLLDCWATWCGPCVAKLGEVERLRERFSAEKRLEVVGRNLDADRSRVESFLRSTKRPWVHVPLGDWATTSISRQLEISVIPAYVLIDPSGNITAQENSLRRLKRRSVKNDPANSRTRSRLHGAEKTAVFYRWTKALARGGPTRRVQFAVGTDPCFRGIASFTKRSLDETVGGTKLIRLLNQPTCVIKFPACECSLGKGVV
jgi:thiol-disulfide isomerase/thioredoxin